ncbi:MAG TPA: carboxypeptidase-like regulatory domain-containing protein [Casimicrobiaceae bacterium]|nr:carboxypeptidase-like regulatory domain-containing protein [Casimicrobiaceae bacterium]
MQPRRLALTAALVAANALTGAALAMPIRNLPPAETQGAVTYRTGGIGQSEAAAMRQAEPKYPLSLEFAERAGPKNWFLANVEVTIKDQHGNTELRTFSDGPFLLARLPNGDYTVTATDNGRSETRHVTIAAGKSEHLMFMWPGTAS